MENVSSANTQFALDFFREVCGTSGNIFFSPLSISAAFAMVYLGAKGNTAGQMSKILSFNMTPDLHSDLKKFISDIDKPDAPYQLTLANRLYGEKTFSFLKEFLDATRKFYQAELEPMDFIGAAEESCCQINQWVEAQTNGKIMDILKPSAINNTTKLVLVNALYFKGHWLHSFDQYDTREMPFKINERETKPVQMMYLQKVLPFKQIEEYGLQIVEMPYKGDELSMFILLPEEPQNGSTPLQKLEKELTLEKINEWTDRKNMDSGGYIDLYLPKFKLEDSYDLKEALAHLGMTDAFDEKLADLTGINREGGLFISAAVHKSFIDVNEEGTEAAAATGISIQLCCLIIGKKFMADHPFLFFIRHNTSKTILFFGRFSSP
ncbi:leukocyte elastase inhibitor-like [Brienomyrus brachyistius]|uniref:leukocyte elastase inhibitor-like n=1 Tax=Brienomyrus brachyistius TaxID=42636 RepID=UPI0020B290A1|nr:leukocyte elastase inhibitor-like [Brienomyrus brachyistius]XP_048860270.1 leukocyte elastase inhibitor-like [Brienomyrus brachyistius]XP_048860341.1 leukocyte elastase inhibitor-like [Brienomyrus brachyistius]